MTWFGFVLCGLLVLGCCDGWLWLVCCVWLLICVLRCFGLLDYRITLLRCYVGYLFWLFGCFWLWFMSVLVACAVV